MSKKKDDVDNACAVASCDRVHTTRSEYCTRCAAWDRYWVGRKKADRYLRFKQVQFWSSRMSQRWGAK